MTHRNDYNPCRNHSNPAEARKVYTSAIRPYREEPCRCHNPAANAADYEAWADAAARDYEDEAVGRWDATEYHGPQQAAGRHHDDHRCLDDSAILAEELNAYLEGLERDAR